MRFFCYAEYAPDDPRADKDGGYIVVMSEDDLRREYWPYWYKKMCEKYEQSYVDTHYSFADCIDDWMVVNWAWEVSNGISEEGN
jgi:hypothetical protein